MTKKGRWKKADKERNVAIEREIDIERGKYGKERELEKADGKRKI